MHGNDPILRAAVNETKDDELKILAVTLLTSFGEEDMKEFFGKPINIEEYVSFGPRRLSVGCHGVISSGLEAGRLREGLGNNFLIVTPGIRPGANITIDGRRSEADRYGSGGNSQRS